MELQVQGFACSGPLRRCASADRGDAAQLEVWNLVDTITFQAVGNKEERQDLKPDHLKQTSMKSEVVDPASHSRL